MANFAKIGLNNEVLNVIVINNLETMTEDGILDENIGIEKLKNTTGHETWLLCGKNLNGEIIRKNVPGIGWFYSQEYDGFYQPRPLDMNGLICNSWTLNESTLTWEPPITKPDNYFKYENNIHEISFSWDEQLYQSDNTKGWTEID
jgi:hypothetical protein